MKIILFGASGMIGQGVLRECLLDPEVDLVLSVGRAPLSQKHAKLREIVAADLGSPDSTPVFIRLGQPRLVQRKKITAGSITKCRSLSRISSQSSTLV